MARSEGDGLSREIRGITQCGDRAWGSKERHPPAGFYSGSGGGAYFDPHVVFWITVVLHCAALAWWLARSAP